MIAHIRNPWIRRSLLIAYAGLGITFCFALCILANVIGGVEEFCYEEVPWWLRTLVKTWRGPAA